MNEKKHNYFNGRYFNGRIFKLRHFYFIVNLRKI